MQGKLLGQLFYNAALTYAKARTRPGHYWTLPFKWWVIGLMVRAAKDPAFLSRCQSTAQVKADIKGAPTLTLEELVRILFDVFLMFYGPELGKLAAIVRVALEAVLKLLDELFVPPGLAYSGVR
jgi:hypothetical protein